MSEHTKGPWKWTDGSLVTMCNGKPECVLWVEPCAYKNESYIACMEEDDNLIAAAPELLEALERIVRDLDNLGREHLVSKEARAALDKARGIK